MSITTILSELWRFVKDKKVKILVGALIVAILAILSGLFLPNILNQTTVEENAVPESIKEEVAESREYLTNIYEQEPAEFELFIQLGDGNAFTNSFIFDEYFTSPAVVEEIENKTGINYSKTLGHEMNLKLYKTSQYRGSIAGIRNTSTNVIMIRVQAAQSSEENLILAEAFEEMVMNNEIPLIEGLQVTSLSEPTIGEKLTDTQIQMVSSPDAIGAISPVESGNLSFALYGIAGFIVGLIMAAVLLFVIQLFKNKITYAFQYSWDFDDFHFLYNVNASRENLKELLLYPEMEKKLIVHQDSSLIEENIKNNQQIKTTNSLLSFSDNNIYPESIVLFIESHKTDKEWYNNQYLLAEMYDSKLTIIHLVD